LKELAPEGTAVEATVWWVPEAMSLFVHSTVLLTPTITVMLSGAYPGAPLGSPAPGRIETWTVVTAFVCGKAKTKPDAIRAKRPTSARALRSIRNKELGNRH